MIDDKVRIAGRVQAVVRLRSPFEIIRRLRHYLVNHRLHPTLLRPLMFSLYVRQAYTLGEAI